MDYQGQATHSSSSSSFKVLYIHRNHNHGLLGTGNTLFFFFHGALRSHKPQSWIIRDGEHTLLLLLIIRDRCFLWTFEYSFACWALCKRACDWHVHPVAAIGWILAKSSTADIGFHPITLFVCFISGLKNHIGRLLPQPPWGRRTQARTEWRIPGWKKEKKKRRKKKKKKKRKPGRTIPWHTPCTTSNILDWFEIICWEPLEVKHYDFKAWKENPTTIATGFRAQQRGRSHSWVFERRLHFLFGQYKQLNRSKTQSSADFICEALSNQAVSSAKNH